MSCRKCGEPCIGELCAYCRGDRARPADKFVTAEELRRRVHIAAERADTFVAMCRDNRIPVGDAVLGLMLAARGLIETMPELPAFEWYVCFVDDVVQRKNG